MKIALFGGTGPTGRHILEEALRQGYQLSVYTRDAGKLSAFGGKIEVVVGDLNNREAIKARVADADAVISALGPNNLKARGAIATASRGRPEPEASGQDSGDGGNTGRSRQMADKSLREEAPAGRMTDRA